MANQKIPFYIIPDWPAPASVKAASTTRSGGCSPAPYNSFNMGLHVGDAPELVVQNRSTLCHDLGVPNDSVQWLNQVHGTDILSLSDADKPLSLIDKVTDKEGDKDGSFTSSKNIALAIMTADCLPVLLCDQAGTQVAAVHAGWRGLCQGIIEKTVACFDRADQVLVWLGPAIGSTAFEVGEEVRQAFIVQHKEAEDCFVKSNELGNKWLADIYGLARLRLNALGITLVFGGDFCTFTDDNQFFSYRRDGQTGRMASLIWLE